MLIQVCYVQIPFFCRTNLMRFLEKVVLQKLLSEGLNVVHVPMKPVIGKILAKRSVISKRLGQKSIINKISAC